MIAGNGSEPLVSAVVPAYNAGDHIEETLQSIAGQRIDFDTEIIVVDDGSTDDTRERVSAFGGARLIQQENAGPSAARNRGIQAARGPFVAFLDADDLWTPDKLATQMALFRAHPDLGLVFGDCRRFDSKGPLPVTFFAEAGLDREFWGDQVLVRDPYAKLFHINYVPTGSAVVRRRVLQASGGFDESMRQVEDLDLWFRIALRFPVGYTSHLCQLKRIRDQSLSSDDRIMDLAYEAVIGKQRRLFGEQIRRMGIPVGRRLAYKYCLMGDRCERSGHLDEARSWYWKGLRTRPSLRPAYYLLRTVWKRSHGRSE